MFFSYGLKFIKELLVLLGDSYNAKNFDFEEDKVSISKRFKLKFV